MKNAEAMLKVILNEVDTSGDGKIQYEGKPGEYTGRDLTPMDCADSPAQSALLGHIEESLHADIECELLRIPHFCRARRPSAIRPFPIDRPRWKREAGPQGAADGIPHCWLDGVESSDVGLF